MFFFSFPKCRMCRISKRHVPTTTSVTKQTESQNRRTSSSCVRFFLHSFPVQVCLLLFHSFRPDPLPWFEDCRLRRKIKFYWSLLLHCDLLDLTKEDLLRRSGVDSTLISLVSCFGWWGDFGGKPPLPGCYSIFSGSNMVLKLKLKVQPAMQNWISVGNNDSELRTWL